jgi:putative ABC transport system ATP-binding protein
MPDLTVERLAVSYPGLNAPVLDIAHLSVRAGERLAIIGPSGSGKSTLVNLITGLERPGASQILWGTTDLARLGEGARDRWRGETIGLVMQDFYLFAGLSAVENVLLPARLSGLATLALIARARMLIERVGLTRPDQKIETMSRGEMQRVAVARALLRRPSVIVADEPTASLDAESGMSVAELLLDLAREADSTLIVVTHDHRLMERLDRHIALEAGRIVADTVRVPQ